MLIPLIYLAAVTPVLSWFDIRQHRLPNVLVLPGLATGLLGCVVEWASSGRVPFVPLIAAVAYSAFLLIFTLFGGMGMGDVKLAAVLGLASWDASVAVLSPVVAFLVGGLVSAALVIAGRRRKRIPFGPFLLGGFWVAVALTIWGNG